MGNMKLGTMWYAVRVTAQKEFVAESVLREHGGFQIFVPVENKWRRYSQYDKRRRLVSQPMLVRYLFAGFDAVPVPWWTLFQFQIVRSVVGSGGVPRAIPERLM